MSSTKWDQYCEDIDCDFIQNCLSFQNEAGRMQLEGCLCEEYYRIRKLLYGQYAIV